MEVNPLKKKQIIPLWPDGTPGVTNDPEHESAPGQFNIIRNPTLTFYPAPGTTDPASCVIICPGGGYGIVSCINEGYPIAEWLNGLGISAFMLKYRLPGDRAMDYCHPVPLADAQQAIRLVRRNAAGFNIKPDRVGVMGFSAGGHLAAMAVTAFERPVAISSDSCRPDFAMLIYPVIAVAEDFAHRGSFQNLAGSRTGDAALQRALSPHLNVTAATPPIFLAHAKDDKCVPYANSVAMHGALQAAGVDSSLHLYTSGGHGFGLGKPEHDSAQWPQAAARWLAVMVTAP